MGQGQDDRDQLTRLTVVMERLTDEMAGLRGEMASHREELRDLKDGHLHELAQMVARHDEHLIGLDSFRSHVWWGIGLLSTAVATIAANVASQWL